VSVIRVVSYNIHKGRSATGARESFSDLRLGLYGLRPDLLFLQEIQGRNEQRISLNAQHESLGAALRMDCAYGCNAVRAHTDHGNALLSRYPIIEHENQDISDHKLEQRGLLHAVVGIDDVPVHCLVVHLGLFAGSRSRQVAALVERIKRLVPDDEPMLIAGDFNDWSCSSWACTRSLQLRPRTTPLNGCAIRSPACAAACSTCPRPGRWHKRYMSWATMAPHA
jgi:endonuclease/exonuclease/phosphatase family metal-dependent hydrolase